MRQTILMLILLALIAATIFVWYAFIRQPAVPGGETGSSATAPEDEDLAQYRAVENLKPDISVLSDPLFQSLSRYRSPNPTPAATPGRANPFLPF